ncbi:MAG: GNAT family N-acetyltransferase [Candidatus Dormibacteria bacterium]
MKAEPEIDRLPPARFGEVAPLLARLLAGQQEQYDHPRQSHAELDREANRRIPERVSAENVIFGASSGGSLVGFCWCLLFDPGNGLEGEVVELYVDPGHRGSGLGARLAAEAVGLFRERGVTFAQVWTRADNEPAVRAYRSAGFTETEQLVLTWLPLEGR